MDLPNKFFVAIFLIFAFTVTSITPTFALSTQPATLSPPASTQQPISGAPTNPVLGQTAPAGEGGQVLAGNPIDWLFDRAGDLVSLALGVVIDGAHALMDKVFIKDSAGCSMDDKACQEEQRAEILRGVPVSEMSNPGAIHLLASGLDTMKEMPIPINSKTYFASINPFKKAEASGFDDLQSSGGLLELWVVLRNAAYALSVLVLVIVGFMIMLRVPLDPRTNVTVQMAIPRLIIALILITFSFAICGLMLDFGRLSLNLVQWVFAQVGIDWGGFILKLIGLILFTLAAGFVYGGPAGIILFAVILALFILILVLWLAFKMIARFAQFIILTAISPFIFLIAAVPGMEGVAIGWFKRQVSNILAIPAIIFMLGLALIVVNSSIPAPVFGGNPLGIAHFLVAAGVALGILFTATRAPEMVDDLLGLKQAPGARAGLTGAAVGGTATTMSRLKVGERIEKFRRTTPLFKAGREKMGADLGKVAERFRPTAYTGRGGSGSGGTAPPPVGYGQPFGRVRGGRGSGTPPASAPPAGSGTPPPGTPPASAPPSGSGTPPPGAPPASAPPIVP